MLTSATLCVGSPPKFDFLQSRLGLTAAETLALGSPFDYPNQVTVHLPRNLPDPSDQPDEFEHEAIRAIAHYLEQTQGKAFVLFTSYKMLDAAARALTPWLARAEHRPLRPERRHAPVEDGRGLQGRRQQRDLRRRQLLAGGRRARRGALERDHHPAAVLASPAIPLLEARLEDIRRRGGNPFVEYQVPEAVIKLKQGFGRLIRTKTDRGIVVILDPRVLTKPYGRTFLNSLPDCPRIVDHLELPGR